MVLGSVLGAGLCPQCWGTAVLGHRFQCWALSSVRGADWGTVHGAGALSSVLGTVGGARRCPLCWGAVLGPGVLSTVLSTVRSAGNCPLCWGSVHDARCCPLCHALSLVLGHCPRS